MKLSVSISVSDCYKLKIDEAKVTLYKVDEHMWCFARFSTIRTI